MSNYLLVDVREDAPGRFRAVVLMGEMVLGSRCWFATREDAEVSGIALADQLEAAARDKFRSEKEGGTK